MPESSLETVIRYHDATKHHPHRYARSLGYLDWANQPDPFRRFLGSPLIRLPIQAEEESPPYDALFSPGAIRAQPVTIGGPVEDPRITSAPAYPWLARSEQPGEAYDSEPRPSGQ